MKTKITFTLAAEIVGEATSGILLGEFNNWNENEGISLKKSKNGDMSASISLEAGQTYQYRYLLGDGRWVNDYNSPNQHDNCVITVPNEAPKTTTKSVDDLTKIRGIGEKIAGVLVENDVDSFEKLANSTFENLRAILDTTGSRAKIYDPTHWAKQASLAAAGKWDDLKKLQAELKK